MPFVVRWTTAGMETTMGRDGVNWKSELEYIKSLDVNAKSCDHKQHNTSAFILMSCDGCRSIVHATGNSSIGIHWADLQRQNGEWVDWVEPFGPNDEPVFMRVDRKTAIAMQKKVTEDSGHTYASDEQALEDFKTVHWASSYKSELTFKDLRVANRLRESLFANDDEWAIGDWVTAVLGELGEAANFLKKVKRGDFTLDQVRPSIADELADVMTYFDVLADKLGIDLAEATISKWNRISEKIGTTLRLKATR